MTRQEVYDLIDGERAYQQSFWTPEKIGREQTVGDYLTLIRRYSALADAAYADKEGDQPALDVMRKIAAIAVHCMEDHGAPARGEK